MNGNFLLDTNIVIALFAKDANVAQRVANSSVSVPVIVIGELLYGARKSGRVKANVERAEESPNLPPRWLVTSRPRNTQCVLGTTGDAQTNPFPKMTSVCRPRFDDATFQLARGITMCHNLDLRKPDNGEKMMKIRNWLLMLITVFGVWQSTTFASPHDVRMDSRSKHQLMVFLQDITAVPVPYFQKGKISNSSLIEFGITQNALRHPDRLKFFKLGDGGYSRIASKYVAASVEERFGMKISNHSIRDWNYKDGYYVGDAAAFEQLGSQPIKHIKVRDLDGKIYKVYFVVDMAQFDGQPPDLQNSVATLRKYGVGKASRFILISYQKAPNFSVPKPGYSKAASSSLIVPGDRVGPVRLGMTRRQIRAILGVPTYVYYGYKIDHILPCEEYTGYHLAFNNDHADGNVVIIEVKSSRFTTSNGISTNSSFQVVQRRYPRMTMILQNVQDMWSFSYCSQSDGIGFCFDGLPVTDDPVRDKKLRPGASQKIVAIAVYKRGGNWKKFYSSE